MTREAAWTTEQLLQLQSNTDVDVTSDADPCREAAADFGRIVQGQCNAVVRPRNAEAISSILEFANARRLGVTVRGGGYSQSGQSVALQTISLDLSLIRKIDIEVGGTTVRCGAGVSFRELLNACSAVGRVPRVMPLNLDLTVGGVLSAGGFGSTSHVDGLVVSTVKSVDVVLGSGTRVTARADAHRGIYDAVLGGLGSFGVIVNAELSLRALSKSIRTYFLLYDNLDAFLDDQVRLGEEQRCDHLEAFCSAAVQGFRRDDTGNSSPFARWFYGLHLGFAHDGRPPHDAAALDQLHHREVLHVEDANPLDHAARYAPRFTSMRATGAWGQAHPWLEFFLSAKVAREIIPEILRTIPLFLGDGHRLNLLRIHHGAGSTFPCLLMTPQESPIFAFAILPMGVPSAFLPRALEALRRIHDRLIEKGAKRYLSGWLFAPDAGAWRTHFGDHFLAWQHAHELFNPHGTLRSALSLPRP